MSLYREMMIRLDFSRNFFSLSILIFFSLFSVSHAFVGSFSSETILSHELVPFRNNRQYSNEIIEARKRMRRNEKGSAFTVWSMSNRNHHSPYQGRKVIIGSGSSTTNKNKQQKPPTALYASSATLARPPSLKNNLKKTNNMIKVKRRNVLETSNDVIVTSSSMKKKKKQDDDLSELKSEVLGVSENVMKRIQCPSEVTKNSPEKKKKRDFITTNNTTSPQSYQLRPQSKVQPQSPLSKKTNIPKKARSPVEEEVVPCRKRDAYVYELVIKIQEFSRLKKAIDGYRTIISEKGVGSQFFSIEAFSKYSKIPVNQIVTILSHGRKSKELLIKQFENMLTLITKKYSSKNQQLITVEDDIYQEACNGLVNAAEHYEEERDAGRGKTSFSTYAYTMIKYSIVQKIQTSLQTRQVAQPRYMIQRQIKLNSYLAKWKGRLNSSSSDKEDNCPDDETICKDLNISLKELDSIRKYDKKEIKIDALSGGTSTLNERENNNGKLNSVELLSADNNDLTSTYSSSSIKGIQSRRYMESSTLPETVEGGTCINTNHREMKSLDGLPLFEELIIGELIPIFLNRLGAKERKILECMYGFESGREMKVKEISSLLSEEGFSNVKLSLNKAIHSLKGNKFRLLNLLQEEAQNTRTTQADAINLAGQMTVEGRVAVWTENAQHQSILQKENKKRIKRLQIEKMLSEDRDIIQGVLTDGAMHPHEPKNMKRDIEQNTNTIEKHNMVRGCYSRHRCEHCGKSFATRQTMLHHVRYNKSCIRNRKI